MKRFALFLGILLLAGIAYRQVGPIGFLVVFLGGVFAWWLMNASRDTPAKVWNLVQALAFVGLLFGGFWTFVAFFASGPMLAVVLLIPLYGLFELRRYAKRRMVAAPDYLDI